MPLTAQTWTALAGGRRLDADPSQSRWARETSTKSQGDSEGSGREANAPASLSLFWTVGLLWMSKGSLSELAQDVAAVLRGGPGSVGNGRSRGSSLCRRHRSERRTSEADWTARSPKERITVAWIVAHVPPVYRHQSELASASELACNIL